MFNPQSPVAECQWISETKQANPWKIARTVVGEEGKVMDRYGSRLAHSIPPKLLIIMWRNTAQVFKEKLLIFHDKALSCVREYCLMVLSLSEAGGEHFKSVVWYKASLEAFGKQILKFPVCMLHMQWSSLGSCHAQRHSSRLSLYLCLSQFIWFVYVSWKR